MKRCKEQGGQDGRGGGATAECRTERSKGRCPMGSPYKISKEKRDEMVSQIKAWFLKEREEELGDLAAILILDFFMEKLANEFYNQGVYDSYKHVSRFAEDLLGIQKF